MCKRTATIRKKINTEGFADVQNSVLKYDEYTIEFRNLNNLFELDMIHTYIVVDGCFGSDDFITVSRGCNFIIHMGPPLYASANFYVELLNNSSSERSESEKLFISTLESSLALLNTFTYTEKHSLSKMNYTKLYPTSEGRFWMRQTAEDALNQDGDKDVFHGLEPSYNSKTKQIQHDNADIGEKTIEFFAQATSFMRTLGNNVMKSYSRAKALTSEGKIASQSSIGLLRDKGSELMSNTASSLSQYSIDVSNIISQSPSSKLRKIHDYIYKKEVRSISNSANYENLIATGKCVERTPGLPYNIKSFFGDATVNKLLKSTSEHKESSEDTLSVDENQENKSCYNILNGDMFSDTYHIRNILFKLGVTKELRRPVWAWILSIYNNIDVVGDSQTVDDLNGETFKKTINESTWFNSLKGVNIDDVYSKLGPKAITSDAAAGDEDLNMPYEEIIVDRLFRVFKDLGRIFGDIDDFYSIANFFKALCDSNSSWYIFAKNDINSENDCLPKGAMVAVLMTYADMDRDVGYLQGMCDILSVIGTVFPTGNLALLSFYKFMKYFSRPNFLRNENGMEKQMRLMKLVIRFFDAPLYAILQDYGADNLFFCFRWLFIFFSRDFSTNEVITIWDAILTCPVTHNYQLFVALAIINKYRNTSTAFCCTSEEFFIFFSSLSSNIGAQNILVRAESLLRAFILKLIGELHLKTDSEKYDRDLVSKLFEFVVDTSTPTTDTNSQYMLCTPGEKPPMDFSHCSAICAELYDPADISSLNSDELLELLNIFTIQKD